MSTFRVAAQALVLVAALTACQPEVTMPDACVGDCGAAGGSAGGDGGGAAGGAGGGLGGGGTGGGSNVRRIVSLAVTPPGQTLQVGGVSSVTATATFDDSSTADVSGTVSWAAAPPTVASLTVVSATDNVVRLEGLAAGTATLTATSGAVSATATVTVTPLALDGGPSQSPPELRAVWVTRFAYNTAAEVRTIIDNAAAGGFNVVYFQIRGTGDAYYRSNLLPWAKKLSGTLGKDPGWDPLQTALDEAHAKGLQLHAYWNVFAAWPVPTGCASTTCTCTAAQGQADSCALPEASFAGAPDHYLRAHPEAMAVNAAGKSVDGEYYWFSAGDPAVRTHLLAAATELLQNYAVDGLHLDRIRYPGPSYSYDPASNAAYAALPAPKPTRADWQREQVSLMVGAIYGAVKQYRPNALLSASVWGIYKPLPGCSTSKGFDDYFQDSLGWMKTARIDAITPMIYWDIGSGCTDWAKLLDGFMAGRNGRPVIAGMHVLDSNQVKPDRLSARVAYARQVGAAGTSMFASTYLDRPPGTASTGSSWTSLRADGGVYAVDAGVPAITWR